MKKNRLFLLCIVAGLMALADVQANELRVLFLGDNGHHRPADRFKQLQPVMREKQIDLVYTESLADLNSAKLAGFDALAIFANHNAIAPEQVAALVKFVSDGGVMVALQCAYLCFFNSDKYIELIGSHFTCQ